MPTHCFTLPSLIFAIQFANLFFAADSKTYWEDVEVLKQLKNGIDPSSVSPGSCLVSWDFNFDPCDSLFSERFTCGFTCSDSVAGASRLTEISLDSTGYAGPILSSTTWNLPYLETLDMSNNFFNGTIPDSVSNLNHLRHLGLSGNSFSGKIPASIGTLSSLEELFLDNNGFRGEIPASFNGLVSLKRLEIQTNNFHGEFPDLRSTSLYFVDCSGNSISGEIGTKLPASLVQLSMRNNKIEGGIPVAIKDLKSLQVLDLSHNNLSGEVPSILFTLPSLQQITLSHNRLSSIQATPGEESRRSELVAVDISNNGLAGFLPDFFPAMEKLSALSLEKNRFSGKVPVQYALKAGARLGPGSARLARLILGGNYLSGRLPSPLMRLKASEATVSLADNCLYSCPQTLFFCQGGVQKPLNVCQSFGPVIPRSL